MINVIQLLTTRSHLCFRGRRESINDDSRGGRLAFLTCSIKKVVKDMVQTDRRTISELLLMNSVFPAQKYMVYQLRISACLKLVLSGYHDYSRKMKKNVAYTVHRSFFTATILEARFFLMGSSRQMRPGYTTFIQRPKLCLRLKKAHIQKSAGKHMFIFFMYQHRMILHHRVPDGQTATTAYHSKVGVIFLLVEQYGHDGPGVAHLSLADCMV